MPNVRNAVLEQARAAFDVILKPIYNTDIKTVSRMPPEAFQLNDTDYPALFISDEGVEEMIDQSDPAAIKHRLLIEVWGFFRDTSKLLSENFNKFIADIMKVIYAPIIFNDSGGNKYADGVRFEGLVVTAESPPVITFRVLFSVVYWFNKTAP